MVVSLTEAMMRACQDTEPTAALLEGCNAALGCLQVFAARLMDNLPSDKQPEHRLAIARSLRSVLRDVEDPGQPASPWVM